VYVPLPRATPCPGLHPAQGVTLRYAYVPPSGEWITVILSCPGLTPCVMGIIPLQGMDYSDSVLPRVAPCPCPGLYPALWICSPFRGI